MANFFASAVSSHAPKEEIRVGGHSVVVKQRIAEGGFGFVDLVSDSQNRDMVLKRCSLQRKESFDIVQKEISLLQRFAGDYVIKLLGSEITGRQTSNPEALLLLEFCPGGHLLERLNSRNGKKLEQDEICRTFGMLLQALLPLHRSDPPVIHRDIKLENILFGADGKLRLIDFGSARIGPMPLRTAEERSVAEEDIAKNTTQMYRAPEMIDLYLRDILTEKTDIWALGCVFYALIFLTHPFQEAGNLGILGGVSNIPAASNVSADAVALIPRMLDIDPEGRPSIPELLECARALLTGQPMPTLVVPEAVLQRRIERAENDKRRMQLLASKQKKNVAPAPRAPAPLDSNSVAARRLAAKRGQVVSGPPAPIQPSAIISPKSLTTKSFDEPKSEAFDSGGHATSGDFFGADFPSTGIISAAANDLFFDDSSAPETITKSAAPFNSPDEFEPSSRKGMIKLFGSAEAVDEPATQYSSSHNDGFDPFSDTAGAATFDPFEEHVSRDSFGGKAGKVDRFSSGFPADDLFNDNQSISGPSTSSVKRTSFGEAEQRHSFTVAASTNTNPWDSDPFTSSATPTKVTYPIVPDPFSTSSQPVPSHPQLSLGNEAFDPFADSAPVMSPTPYQPPANGSRSGSATFLDDFTNVSLTSNQKPKRNSNELLSLFDQQTHVPGPTTTQGYGRRGSGGENMIGGYGLPTSGMHHTSGPSFGAGQGFFNHPPAGYGHAPNNPFGPPPNDPFGNLGVFPKRG